MVVSVNGVTKTKTTHSSAVAQSAEQLLTGTNIVQWLSTLKTAPASTAPVTNSIGSARNLRIAGSTIAKAIKHNTTGDHNMTNKLKGSGRPLARRVGSIRTASNLESIARQYSAARFNTLDIIDMRLLEQKLLNELAIIGDQLNWNAPDWSPVNAQREQIGR